MTGKNDDQLRVTLAREEAKLIRQKEAVAATEAMIALIKSNLKS